MSDGAVGFTHNYPADDLVSPVSESYDGSYDNQCTWSGNIPKPLVLHVSCRRNDEPGEWWLHATGRAAIVTAGLISNDRSGWLEIEYGAGATQQVRRIDVRSGSYQLPPCTYAKVGVRRFNPLPAPGKPPMTVSCTLAPGVHPGQFAPATWSRQVFAGGGASVNVELQTPPRAARYWWLQPDRAPNNTQVTAPGVSIDYNSPSAFPPWPLYPMDDRDDMEIDVVSVAGAMGLLWAFDVVL